MSETINLIIKKIAENKSINQICEELNISVKKLHYYLRMLKNKGYVYKPTYYPNGEIVYNTDCLQTIKMYNRLNNLDIAMGGEETNLKTLVISDLHFGNKLERLDLVEQVFDYCIKNNVHIILCCGDLLDGTFTQGEKRIQDGIKQVEYFISKYPYDKNISTLAVLGDHDFSILREYNYDPAELIKQHRHDIGIGGYNLSTVNVKNERILLHHNFINDSLTGLNASRIILHGHYHNYCAKKSKQNVLHVNVPALCNIMTSTPGALEMSLSFKKKRFQAANIKQLETVDGNMKSVNEVEFRLSNTSLAEDDEEILKDENPVVKIKDLCL